MCRGLASLPTTCLERAKELRARLGIFCQKADSSHSEYSNKADQVRPTPDEALKWKESFETLLKNKHGLATFRKFLILEFSEENIAFYLACEDYKIPKSTSKLDAMAKKIYEEFIESDAPREVNIDHETRNITKFNLVKPSISCFDLAQNKIYTLMEKDSYPRFLRSALYQDLIKKATYKSAKQQISSKKSHT
ncbi:regulator of G-protein signaling 5-like isoform X1 [Lepisosteus oculatus]|uniref:regulator of G-protein signaling 5-like isoform X1 n=1 Tax=Lepisosteus oculatus TaxID=7918 RepID=UPI00371129FC